jgi:GxxExxY protein
MNHKAHEEHHEGAFSPVDAAVERVVREVIGAGLSVHRSLGPGFVEPVYGRALAVELGCRGVRFDEQAAIAVRYRGEVVARHRLDLLVEGCVVVEVKAVKKLRPIHEAQILSYLKASGCRVGLLINFNVKLLKNGLRRFVR